MHVELPVVSFICSLLVLIPLPWHLKTGNTATISIAIWLFLGNLINGINSIIWADNRRIVVPAWCDIATKIVIGINVALPSSVFCLCAHLERASSVGEVTSYHLRKRRILLNDFILCFAVPILYMILHFIVQSQRFDIVEGFGCRANVYDSAPSILLVWVPPLVFSLAACISSGLAFRNFWIRRIAFAEHLQNSSSFLTPSQYFRLMSMALVQVLWSVSIVSLNLWLTLKRDLPPWISWNDVHSNFSHIGVFPISVFSQQDLTYTFIRWWAIPVSSIIYFAFALSQETIAEYGLRFSWPNGCFSWLQDLWLNITDRLPTSHAKYPSFPTHLEVEISIAKSTDKLPSPLSPKFAHHKPDVVYPVPLHAYGHSIYSVTSKETTYC